MEIVSDFLLPQFPFFSYPFLFPATGSREFNEFLNLLGETVKLKDCSKYTGGLNIDGHDGETTLHTTFRGIQIAFHVSTLIPHSATDTQQIRRKRHLGNDNVLIVWKEGKQLFNPAAIRSHFNSKDS
jgi:hypothetical protein